MIKRMCICEFALLKLHLQSEFGEVSGKNRTGRHLNYDRAKENEWFGRK